MLKNNFLNFSLSMDNQLKKGGTMERFLLFAFFFTFYLSVEAASANFSCSGAHCKDLILAKGAKNLCSPSSRWIFNGRNNNTCYPTCAQSVEDFCRDNYCSGFSLLRGPTAQDSGNNELFREEAIHLDHWLPVRGHTPQERRAKMGCILTSGKRRKPTYSPSSSRPAGANKYYAPKNACPKNSSWNHNSAPNIGGTCFPSCQVMVDNFCRGKDCSDYRIGTPQECRGRVPIRFQTHEPLTSGRKHSCCLVSATESGPSQPASAVNLGTPDISFISIPRVPEKQRNVRVNFNTPLCGSTSKAANRKRRFFRISVRGVKSGDRLAIHRGDVCYGRVVTNVVANSSSMDIDVPFNATGGRYHSIWIEQSQQCVESIFADIKTGYETECRACRYPELNLPFSGTCLEDYFR